MPRSAARARCQRRSRTSRRSRAGSRPQGGRGARRGLRGGVGRSPRRRVSGAARGMTEHRIAAPRSCRAMIVTVPATDFADLSLARHPRFSGFVDSDEANAQAALLRANGLDTVNAKVLRSPLAEVLDVITEHNVGAMLVRRGLTALQHEPLSMAKPVDFVGARGGRSYLVEVRRLAASERDTLGATPAAPLSTAHTSGPSP